MLKLIVMPPGIGRPGVIWLISLGIIIPSTSSYSFIVVSTDITLPSTSVVSTSFNLRPDSIE